MIHLQFFIQRIRYPDSIIMVFWDWVGFFCMICLFDFLWLSFENDCQNRHAKQSTSTTTTTHNAYYNISKETTASSVFYLPIQWGSEYGTFEKWTFTSMVFRCPIFKWCSNIQTII